MQRFIDIHTHHDHHDHQDPDILAIRNIHDNINNAAPATLCSIGVHPWHVDHHDIRLDHVMRMATLPSVMAIGECGLDKVCATDFALQQDIFQHQIILANRVNKPLIIHCVRAFDEAIRLLDHASVPVIFHGFQKNPALAQRLVDLGFYLSFGAALTRNQKNAIDSLSLMPLDRVFLETDDGDTDIQHIYHHAALIRGITQDALITQLQHNYTTVFHR